MPLSKASPLPEKNSANFIFSAKRVILAFVKASPPWGKLSTKLTDEGRNIFRTEIDYRKFPVRGSNRFPYKIVQPKGGFIYNSPHIGRRRSKLRRFFVVFRDVSSVFLSSAKKIARISTRASIALDKSAVFRYNYSREILQSRDFVYFRGSAYDYSRHRSGTCHNGFRRCTKRRTRRVHRA